MQRRRPVALRGMLSRSVELLPLVWRRLGAVIVSVAVSGLEDNGPAGGEDGVVDVEVVRFEGEASKDGRYGNGLPIGKVNHTWRHGGRFLVYSTIHEHVRQK